MNESGQRQRLAALDEVDERGLVVSYRCGPFEESGILVRTPDGIVGWRNQCRHLAVRLDGERPGEVGDRDGRHLVCQQHGALYRPDDGECVAGPCRGSRLRPLPIVIADGSVFLEVAGLGGLLG